MKKTMKLLTLLLAVVMILAMATTAFAEDQILRVDERTENGSITVNKYVVVDKDAPVPEGSFTFTLTPVADTTGMTSEGQAIKSGIAVTNNQATISFDNESRVAAGTDATNTSGITTAGANQEYATGTGTISFAGVAFTEPGIYRYALAETIPADEDKIAGMTYDLSEFYVDIYVGYSSATGAAGAMEILGVKTFRYVNKDGSDVETIGSKVTNQFANAFDSDNLLISKTVTGNMGDRNKEFTFSLTVTANDQLADGTELNAVLTDASGATRATTVTVGTAYSFTLKHGESLEVKGLPQGTSYTVTENDYATDSYTTSVVSTRNSVDGEASEVRTITDTIVAGGNAEAFTNNKNITTPTGILLDIAPYAIVVLLAGAAIVLMLLKKRRSTSK